METINNDESATTRHLNSAGLEIRTTPEKGRGVYSTTLIAKGTLVEVSPVLLFTSDEWEAHGKHTVLDHYTFVWRTPGEQPGMALALGLGSIFNHSSRPNVSYHRRLDTLSIEYTTTSDVQPGEELCISYGDESRLWFKLADAGDPDSEEDEGPWGGLDTISAPEVTDSTVLNLDEVVEGDDLPFERIKSDEELEEDETDAIKTFDVWVVDVEDSKQISVLLRHLRETALDCPELSHLRRVRKGDTATVLLSAGPPPPLPLPLPDPYLRSVPKLPAKDKDDLVRKNMIWPMDAVTKSRQERAWTRGEVESVRHGLQKAVEAARLASSREELPVASYVCASAGEPSITALAHDTRQSTNHPLRHSVLGAIRSIADARLASSSLSIGTTPPTSADVRNGDFYLLTSLTLFTTHEPCIMCTMALVHSRVRDVFFIERMPGTGGCGGAEGHGCGVVGKGVNHRFGVWKWKGTLEGVVQLQMGIDA